MALPVNTRKIKIELHFFRSTGSTTDGYADIVTLTINGSANLVSNPGAESGTTGWTSEAGGLGSVAYSTIPITSGNQPTSGGGSNCFNGGSNAYTRAAQTVDVSSYATQIDATTAIAQFSAWLGGFSTDEDFVYVRLQAMASDNTVLSTWYVRGPSAAERSSTSKLLYYSQQLDKKQSGLPAGTRTLKVYLQFLRDGAGSNDGLIDLPTLTISGGSNLITNNSAETNVTGWTNVYNTLNRASYSSESISSPPSGAGSFCFTGAGTTFQIVRSYQSVDVSSLASSIDAGTATAVYSVYLGGWSTQNDCAQSYIEALDGTGTILDMWFLRGPTAAERSNVSAVIQSTENLTGIVPDTGSGSTSGTAIFFLFI